MNQSRDLRDELIALAQINSGSFNVGGVDRVGAHFAERLRALGAEVETIAVPPLRQLQADGEWLERPLGKVLRARRAGRDGRQVFLGGHLDTVFAADDPFQRVAQPEPDILHGPGVADIKGGLLVMCEALARLESGPQAGVLGWEVILNPDEEIGSPGSAPLLAEAAGRNLLGLVFEPALPGGVLAAGRKGSGNFTLEVFGRAAHAGRDHGSGRNAIRALADFTSMLDALNGCRDGVTVNPATVHGGGTINRVPDRAHLHFNVRVPAPEDAAWARGEIDRLVAGLNAREGIAAELHGGFHRPPRPRSAALTTLYGWLRECAAELDLALDWQDTGGCCDGNNLAAAGLVTIDTLGVVGGDIHSDREWMRLSSLAERAELAGLLLQRLAAGDYAAEQLREHPCS